MTMTVQSEDDIDILSILQARREFRPKRGLEFYASEMAFCHRKIALSILYPRETTLTARMALGVMMHEMLEAILDEIYPIDTYYIETEVSLSAEYGKATVLGRIDGIALCDHDQAIIIEVKSTGRREHGLREWYWPQIVTYYWLVQKTTPWRVKEIHILHLLQRSLALRRYRVSIPSEDDVQRVLRKIDTIVEAIEKNSVHELPGPQYDWECEKCEWREECQNLTK